MNADGSDHRQVTRVAEDQDYPENDYLQTMGPRWSPDGRRLLYFTQPARQPRSDDLPTSRPARRQSSTIATGSHHPVGWLDDRTVAYVSESYQHAAGPVREAARRRRSRGGSTYSGQAAFRPEHFDRLESVTWTSADGVKVHGYLRRPSMMRARRSASRTRREPHLQRRPVLQPVEPHLQLHRPVRLRVLHGEPSRLERLRHGSSAICRRATGASRS